MKPKIGLTTLGKKPPASRSTEGGSNIRELFETFLSLECEATSVNRQKAELFAKAKGDGFDRKALQAAFRHRKREIDKPDVTATHDALTDSYLSDLRGSDRDGAHPGNLQVPELIAPADAVSDPLARPRPRARKHEAVDTPDSGPVHSNDPDAISSAVKKMPIMEEEPDIPDFLDARKQSKQPIPASDGGK